MQLANTKIVILAGLLASAIALNAQNTVIGPEQDCLNAIAITSHASFPYGSYVGIGMGSNEVNMALSCLPGENNSVWFKVCMASSGTLAFTLCPNGSNDDYDWAVFDLSGNTCSDIVTDATLQKRCNASGSTFPTNCTGANGGAQPQDAAVINVTEGQTYYIVVNRTSGTTGFSIDFSTSTALFGPNCTTGNTVIAPEQDCVGAIPVCDLNYLQIASYEGPGNQFNEISPANSCIASGELNSCWYKVYVTTNGLLGFSLIPLTATDDYDWAVFNLTGDSCQSIFNNPNLAVSCNFSSHPDTTGPNNGTGPGNELMIPALAGEVYYIYVGNFSTGQNGYNINFSISTCGLDTCLQQVTHIVENEVGIEAILYPNPATQNITLQISGPTNQNYEVGIYNSAGALIKQITGIKQPKTTVDVSALASGLYYYRIYTVDGKTAAGRFVKE